MIHGIGKIMAALVPLLGLAVVESASALTIMPMGDSLTEGLCALGPVPGTDCQNPYDPVANPVNSMILATFDTTTTDFCGVFAKQMVENFNSGNLGGYRGPLITKLRNAGFSTTYKGHGLSGNGLAGADRGHEGHAGWAIKHINKCVSGYVTAQHPDTVLLQIGTNDLIGVDPTLGLAQDILTVKSKIASSSPSTRVIIAAVPSKFTPGGAIDPTFEARRKDISQRVAAGSNYDYPCTGRNLPDMGVLTAADMNTSAASGGVHPNNAGYSKMADIWFSSITSPECQFDSRVFVQLPGLPLLESITANGRYWNLNASTGQNLDSGWLNATPHTNYQNICAGKAVCTFDTRIFLDSANGPAESITAYNKYYNYSSAGALTSTGNLSAVLRYGQNICTPFGNGNCVFDTRAIALRSGGVKVETITAYGRYFDFNATTNAFIASGTLASVSRYNTICAFKPASQTYCTFDTRTYVQLSGLPYLESITAYGRYWNFDANTGALLDSGTLAAVSKYKHP